MMDTEEKLRRLRAKAEERERVREEQLQNKDSLEAIREVYGLSELELQKLEQEVDAEYAAENKRQGSNVNFSIVTAIGLPSSSCCLPLKEDSPVVTSGWLNWECSLFIH